MPKKAEPTLPSKDTADSGVGDDAVAMEPLGPVADFVPSNVRDIQVPIAAFTSREKVFNTMIFFLQDVCLHIPSALFQPWVQPILLRCIEQCTKVFC